MNARAPHADLLTAARLCTTDPALGGIVLRGGDGAVRDAVVAALREGLGRDAPLRRLPAHIDDARLLGGLDFAATLAAGRPVAQTGLLAEADGGVLVVPMAERLPTAIAGRIGAAIDAGQVQAEREGFAIAAATRFVTVALDDGVEPDESLPDSLAERLAFRFDLDRDAQAPPPPPADEAPIGDDEVFSAIAGLADALGVGTMRAPVLAVRAARAAARVAGRGALTRADLALAVRLVLVPRATRMPAPAVDEAESPPPPPPASQDPDDAMGAEQAPDRPLQDIVLEAALAALPRDMLARIGQAGAPRQSRDRGHGAGERRKSLARGRPLGTRAGMPVGGRRLSLIDTLRAAAPWQRLRDRDGRIEVRRDDLRIRRFAARAQILTIFAVDASGSAALARLAEAKGAVELLLAQAYSKRAQVALIAFRGTAADVLLPPTRSLTRARRSLADLPGGGGTPLAAGLEAARALAEAARGRGQTPFVVVLTDGRANIAADGRAVRSLAEEDARKAARAIAQAGIAGAFVDTSARPRPEAAALAAAMGARYLPLPRADSAAMHAALGAVRPA